MKFLDEELLDKYVKSAINQIEDNIDDFKKSFSKFSVRNKPQTYGELVDKDLFSFDYYYMFKFSSFSPMADYIKYEIDRGNIFEDWQCFEFVEVLSALFVRNIGKYDVDIPYSNIETSRKIVADHINHVIIENYLVNVIFKLQKKTLMEYDLSERNTKDMFNIVYLHYHVINCLCAELMLQDICSEVNEYIDSLTAKINMKEDVK